MPSRPGNDIIAALAHLHGDGTIDAVVDLAALLDAKSRVRRPGVRLGRGGRGLLFQLRQLFIGAFGLGVICSAVMIILPAVGNTLNQRRDGHRRNERFDRPHGEVFELLLRLCPRGRRVLPEPPRRGLAGISRLPRGGQAAVVILIPSDAPAHALDAIVPEFIAHAVPSLSKKKIGRARRSPSI